MMRRVLSPRAPAKMSSRSPADLHPRALAKKLRTKTRSLAVRTAAFAVQRFLRFSNLESTIPSVRRVFVRDWRSRFKRRRIIGGSSEGRAGAISPLPGAG